MTNAIIQALEDGFDKAKALVMGVGDDITTELVTVIHQLDPIILSAIESAVPVVISGAFAGTPVASIAAAVESAALATLSAQGKPVLESDALALKGAVLATIANQAAAAVPAEAPAPAPVAEPVTE